MSVSRLAAPERATALRVHRMRVARGACWVIAFALLTGAALTLLDAAAWLSPWLRGLGLALWLTASGVSGWYFVLGRWRAECSTNAARAAAREATGNVQAAAAASVVLLGSLLAALLVPNAAIHVRRVALPWYRTGNPYHIVVTSNNPVVPRGETVVLSAYVESDDHAPLPVAADLVCRDIDGKQVHISMTPDGTGAFRGTYPDASADFEYRVEAAGASSSWYTVTFVEPAAPTGETRLEVIPPAYMAAIVDKQLMAGFVPVKAMQYSRLEMAIKLTSAPSKVKLEWRAEPKSPGEPIPTKFVPGEQLASGGLVLKESGWVILTTTWKGERGGEQKSEYRIAITVTPDTPPQLERLSGLSPLPLRIRLGQKLQLELAANDDIEVGTVSLEFAVGSASPQILPIPVTRPSPRNAVGAIEWALPEGLRAGDSVRYRIRVADTRHLPEQGVNPQEAVYPRPGWATLVIDPAAPPLAEQEIDNQREYIKQGLGTAAGELRELVARIEELRVKANSTFERESQLQTARQKMNAVGHSLEDLAAVMLLTPDLRSLAGAVRQVVHQRLHAIAEVLSNAANSAETGTIGAATANSIGRLTLALATLERLSSRNLSLAQARLDSYRLTSILGEQRALAEGARPGSGIGPEELVRRQNDLHLQFLHVIEQSEPLRLAMANANRQAILSLASEVSELGAAVSALDSALKSLDAEVRKELLTGLADDTAMAADRVAVVLARAESAARLAAFPLPKPESFRHAGELLIAGKGFESLTELQRLADALSGLALHVEKAATERADPKAAAHQYSIWLEDQLARFRVATQANPGGLRELPIASQKAIRDEFSALRAAADSLPLLPGSGDLKELKADISTRLREVEETYGRSASAAEMATKAALTAISRLADRLPGVHDRLAASRGELDRILQEQDAIRSAIGPLAANRLNLDNAAALSTLRKNFEAVVARQEKQLELFKALDLPRLELRRERTLAGLAAAAADLRGALPYDVYASQEWVKKELDELKHILADRTFAGEDATKDLRSVESDHQRIQRLSWNRRIAAEQAIGNRGQPPNPTASAAAKAALEADLEVLMATRTGPAGQFLKQRVRDQYIKLRNPTQPDHMPLEQNALADSLNELAAMMADIDDLTRTFEPFEKDYVAVAADRYLPSRPLAAELRTLERDYRAIRERLTGLAAEVQKRMHASGNERVADLQKQHETRGDELATRARKLAESLQAAAGLRHSDDPIHEVLTVGSRSAVSAAKHLASASAQTRKGEIAAAEKERREAISLFTEHAKRIAALAPELSTPADPKLAAAAEELLRADIAMRQVQDRLGPTSHLADCEKAMRAACEALTNAISKRLIATE